MSEAVIRTDGLTKHYGKLVAVDQVSLEVLPGRVFALMGRNGAGKSTLIRMLLGLTPITGGSGTVLGLDSHRDHVEIRKRVGYVPETHHMYTWMRVNEILDFSASFYPTWDNALCADLVKKFGLDPQKKVKELSRGMVAKVALTIAIAHRPQLLVLDEPMSGLDAVIRKEFLESIVDVAADEGRTVFISSHLLHDVERVADRIALLDHGKIRFVEDAEKLKARVREVKATFAAAPPEKFDMPGVLSLAKDTHEWLLVMDNFTDQTLPQLSARLPGAKLQLRDMNLEEIFVSLVGREAE